MTLPRGMMQGMARLYLLIIGLEILLVVLALISCLSAEAGEVRVLPRPVWVVVILLFPLIGSVVYFLAGRPQPAETGGGGVLARSGHPASPRPPAPDDDPDFLRTIDRRTRAANEERLQRWEDDLRRREEELRKRNNPLDDPPADRS
jgi:hypothetical protein